MHSRYTDEEIYAYEERLAICLDAGMPMFKAEAMATQSRINVTRRMKP